MARERIHRRCERRDAPGVRLRIAAYIGGLLGLALLIGLFIRADLAAMLHTLALAGWPLLWIVPWRLLYFLLYSIGWSGLLRPYNADARASFAYIFWATTLREGVDRLLPVATVGGSVVGVRVLRWRGISAAAASSSVIVEIMLTVVVLYLFTALGLLLLFTRHDTGVHTDHLLLGLLLALPVPVALPLLLRYGSVFKRLERFIAPLAGQHSLAEGAAALDQALQATLRRQSTLFYAGALQFIAILSGSFENWYVLRLCGHPIGFGGAVILESMIQGMRHVAFFVPAGIGVQEGVLVVFGQVLGVSGELALAVSMAKRVREVLCGLPPLLSWHWLETRRLTAAGNAPRGS